MSTTEGNTAQAPAGETAVQEKTSTEAGAGEAAAATETTEKPADPARSIATVGSNAVATFDDGDLGDRVFYRAADEDHSHGITAGDTLVAIVVKVNEGKANLHIHASDSAQVLFKANVQFGSEPGQANFRRS